MNTDVLYSKRFRPFMVLLVLILLFPLVLNSSYMLSLFILIGIYSIVTLGLSLLMGYAGQVSIGHAAFFGIGAYSSGILTVQHGWSPILAMLVGVLITTVVALVVGIPTVKLKEHFLTLATIGFNIIVYVVLVGMYETTGGASGLSGIPKFSFFGWKMQSDLMYYFVVWGIVLLVALLSLNIVQSHVGRVLRAIHDSEIAASTQGVQVANFKLNIFVISAIFASIAGSLYAHYLNFIAPPTFFVTTSIQFLVMIAIGGSQPIWGAILGASLMTLLSEGIKALLPMLFHVSGQVELVVYGVALVLVIMYLPKGLYPILAYAVRKITPNRASVQSKAKGA